MLTPALVPVLGEVLDQQLVGAADQGERTVEPALLAADVAYAEGTALFGDEVGVEVQHVASVRFERGADADHLDDGAALVFRITDCRVQNARARTGMEFHPCKSVGELEYAGFAAALDDRIHCECVSCFPDITDNTCNCAWLFRMEG